MILLANTTTINKNTHINKFQINSTTVDASSDALSASSDVLLRTTSSDGSAKTKKNKNKKRKTLRTKKGSTALKFKPNKQEPKYNWVQEVRAESKTVRCVSLMILACSCAVTSRSFHAPHPTDMREPASQTAGKNTQQQVLTKEKIIPTSQEKDARYQVRELCH